MSQIEGVLRKDFRSIDKREELHRVVGWLRGEVKDVPIITDEGRTVGILTDRGMMARRLDHRAKIENYTVPTRAISVHAGFDDAIAMMREHRASYVPVADGAEEPIGYVQALDIARSRIDGASARELCRPTLALHEKSTMGEAVNVFMKEYIDYLPVLDANERLSGIMSRRAVLNMELAAGEGGRKDAGRGERTSFLREEVGGFADGPAIELDATADVAQTLRKLDDHGYAIVRSGEDVLGVVTAETLFQR